ncbi:MAG TPA: hypothetical protein VFQ91_16365 [Bryobacteraceae bacterium]|nr:hypothetical protein [Bryobacteraceae bacterium]
MSSLPLCTLCLTAAVLIAQVAPTNIITTFAGANPSIDSAADPLAVPLPPGAWGKPAADPAGNIYFSLTNQHVVLRLTPAGRLERFAGNGIGRFTGDGGAARLASLQSPRDIAADSKGNIYIADAGNRRVRRVTPSGVIETFAGGGTGNPSVSGVPRLSVAILPTAIAVDGNDNVYLNVTRATIARVDANSPTIRLYAGGRASTTVGTALDAAFNSIGALAADRAGNLYVADSQLSRVTAAGRWEVIASGSGFSGVPDGVTVTPAGDIYFVQSDTPAIFRVNPAGRADIYAGSVEQQGFSPNGVTPGRAFFGAGLDVSSDTRGNLIVTDPANGRLRRISSTVDTIAGASYLFAGEGGQAVSAVFARPTAIAATRAGWTYFSDAAARLVFSIDARGTVRRFAGNGVLNGGYVEGRPALESPFGTPYGIAVDPSGNVYVADEDCSVRRIGYDGVMTLHAGSPGTCGTSRDGIPAKDARLGRLRGLAADAAGNVYVSDIGNNKVWRIGADGVLRTFAGTGQAGNTIGSALQTALRQPLSLVLAADGALFIADSANNRILRVDANGAVSVAASVSAPTGIAVDAGNNLYYADGNLSKVYRIENGKPVSLAGQENSGFRGDGGPAVEALLDRPVGLAVNSSGDLLIADSNNGRLRRILAAAPTIAISVDPVTITPTPGDYTTRGALQLPSPIPGLGFTAAVAYTGAAANWLTVTPRQGTLPAQILYETNTAGLAAGDYTAVIVVTTPRAVPRESRIPVTIKVPNVPARPFVVLGNNRLTLAAPRAGTAQQSIAVLNPGASAITVAAVVTQGDFLSVAPASLTIAPGQTGAFTATASAAALPAGTYAGIIRLAGGSGAAQVNAYFNIGAAARQRIVLSQSGLSFKAVAGGVAPRPQLLYAAGSDSVTAAAVTVSGIPWLNASVDGNRVVLSVNAQDLAAGDHYARVTVADAANPIVRQTATVLLQVLPAGSEPGAELYPNAIFYTAAPGGAVAGQDVELVLPSGRTASFSATGATNEGQPWLQFFPDSGKLDRSSSGRVTIQPDLSGLGPGVYRGNVTLALEDGQSRTVAILAVVSAVGAASLKESNRAASGCSNENLFPQVLSPASNFRATIGEPLRLAVRVVDGCGNLHQPEGGGTAGVAVTGMNGQVVNLAHIGGGVWESTVTPNAVQASSTLTFLGLFTRGTFLQAGAEKVNGAIVTAPRPVVFADSLTDAASFQFGAPVGPGTLVSLFGANLNESNAIPSALPLPQRLGDVEVRLNDEPIPLLFAGPGQVNAQIPYSLDADGEYQLEIRRGSALTTPQPVVIAQSRPGIFTVDQSGQGQGHIYRALPSGDQVLADSAHAAAAGEVLVIYCNGLGLTNPSVVAGDAAPVSPLAQTANPVTLTIGGMTASIAFSGLAPGFTGLYQVNAVVPAGISPGPQVPVTLTVAGQSSVPVNMGIR